jgi:hypothetical protein
VADYKDESGNFVRRFQYRTRSGGLGYGGGFPLKGTGGSNPALGRSLAYQRYGVDVGAPRGSFGNPYSLLDQQQFTQRPSGLYTPVSYNPPPPQQLSLFGAAQYQQAPIPPGGGRGAPPPPPTGGGPNRGGFVPPEQPAVPTGNKFRDFGSAFGKSPFTGTALTALGVFSAYASGDQERANSIVIPALVGSSSVKLLDKGLSTAAREAVRSGATSFPFAGNNLSLQQGRGVIDGRTIYEGALLQGGKPIKPFSLSSKVGFGSLVNAGLLTYDATQALSGDPLASRRGTTNFLAGATGLGTFYAADAYLASTGVGAIPSALLAGGASILTASGAGYALGLRAPTSFEARGEQIQNVRNQFLSTGLDLGGAGAARNFGTRDFTKSLNPIQSAATGISTFFDLYLGALNPLVTGPSKLLGAPTADDVRKLQGELAGRAQSGSGEFQGLSPAQVAVGLAQFGGRNTPVGNIGDVVGRGSGQGNYITQLLRDTDTLIQNRAEGLGTNQRFTQIQAETIERDIAISKHYTQRASIDQAEIRNIVGNYRKPTLPVQPKRDLTYTDAKTGFTRTYQKQQTGGDVLFGAANKILTEAGRFFSRGKRTELQTSVRVSKGTAQAAENRIGSILGNATSGKLAAYQRILQTAPSKRAEVSKSLTNKQLNSDGGGGRGGYRTYSRVNYAALAEQRHRQIQAERAFGAGNKLIAQKFEEGLSTVIAPDFNDIKFDYRSVNAAVADILPGDVSPGEYKSRFQSAYKAQVGVFGQQVGEAKQQFDAFRGEIQGAANQYKGVLKSRGGAAPSAEGAIDTQTAASRIQTDVNRILIRPAQQIDKLTKSLVSLNKQMDPATQNSFAYFVAQTAKVATSESRYLRQQGLGAQLEGVRDQKYTLESDRRLGLVSTERFIGQQAKLDRQELQLQKENYKLTLAEKTLTTKNQADTLRAGYTDALGNKTPASAAQLALADQLEGSLQYYRSSNQSRFAQADKDLSPAAIKRKQQQAYQQEFATDFQPIYNALFSSSQKGVNPIGALGTQFSSVFSTIAGAATSNLISTLPGVQDIFGPLLHGDIRGLSKGLATKLGGYVDPATQRGQIQLRGQNGNLLPLATQKLGGLAGYANPQIAQKSIAYGALGYQASQYLANKISPYQNSTVGGLGAIAGNLLGAKFGDVGAGIGSAVGGLLGALPISQTPIGGALTGAFSGFLAGNAIVPGIGGVVGGLIGGIAGLFGGKKSREEKRAAEAQKKAQEAQYKQQGIAGARSDLRGGIDYASDLFSGYGSFSGHQKALEDYLTIDAFHSRNNLAGGPLDDKTLPFADNEFNRAREYFKPIQALADRYSPILSRPGAFQGALYDETLKTTALSQRGGAFSSGPSSDLANTFSGLQANLGQYGFDNQRGDLAYNVFATQYQNQIKQTDYQIGIADRNFQDTIASNRVSRLDRGIQTDIFNKQVTDFDKNSQKDVENALGTLQRRENRAQIVKDLQEDQSFNKDILTRKKDVFDQSNVLAAKQEGYAQQDALKNLEDLTKSRRILTETFAELGPRLVDASTEFYTMTEAVKEVNRQLELLSRNLR